MRQTLMKISLLILFLFESSLVRVDCQNCIEKSFDINLKTSLTDVDKQNVKFFYTIVVSSALGTSDKEQYATKCFKSVIFKYRAGQIEGVTEKEYTNKLDQFVEIENLNYLTSYQFDISYKQVSNDGKELIVNLDSLKNLKVNTCFGVPDQPANVTNLVALDGSILFSWTKPANIAAPYLCYYLISIRDLTTNTVTNIPTQTTQYIVQPGDRKNNLRFDLSTYNEINCFEKEYSFAKDCKVNKTSSSIYSYSINSIVVETTTTSNPSGNSSNKSSVSYLALFFFFCLNLYRLNW